MPVGWTRGDRPGGWGGDDVRPLDMYFKGGETIRGFDRAGYGPRDLFTGDALGGQTYWAATAEVRFPLPFIPEDIGLSGAVFADAGPLWGSGDFAAASNNCADNSQFTNGSSRNICLADDSTIRSSGGESAQSPCINLARRCAEVGVPRPESLRDSTPPLRLPTPLRAKVCDNPIHCRHFAATQRMFQP